MPNSNLPQTKIYPKPKSIKTKIYPKPKATSNRTPVDNLRILFCRRMVIEEYKSASGWLNKTFRPPQRLRKHYILEIKVCDHYLLYSKFNLVFSQL